MSAVEEIVNLADTDTDNSDEFFDAKEDLDQSSSGKGDGGCAWSPGMDDEIPVAEDLVSKKGSLECQDCSFGVGMDDEDEAEAELASVFPLKRAPLSSVKRKVILSDDEEEIAVDEAQSMPMYRNITNSSDAALFRASPKSIEENNVSMLDRNDEVGNTLRHEDDESPLRPATSSEGKRRVILSDASDEEEEGEEEEHNKVRGAEKLHFTSSKRHKEASWTGEVQESPLRLPPPSAVKRQMIVSDDEESDGDSLAEWGVVQKSNTENADLGEQNFLPSDNDKPKKKLSNLRDKIFYAGDAAQTQREGNPGLEDTISVQPDDGVEQSEDFEEGLPEVTGIFSGKPSMGSRTFRNENGSPEETAGHKQLPVEVKENEPDVDTVRITGPSSSHNQTESADGADREHTRSISRRALKEIKNSLHQCFLLVPELEKGVVCKSNSSNSLQDFERCLLNGNFFIDTKKCFSHNGMGVEGIKQTKSTVKVENTQNESDSDADENSLDKLFAELNIQSGRKHSSKERINSPAKDNSMDSFIVPDSYLSVRDNDGLGTIQEDDMVTIDGSDRKPEPPPTPSAKTKRIFLKEREELARQLYKEFNESIFKSELPAIMNIIWKKTLNTTAGRTILTRSSFGKYSAEIELSTKVIDQEYRLKNTLCHEMCHAAAWLINHISRPAHGKAFKYWAYTASSRYPELDIKTCHNYDIDYKYRYKCQNARCQRVYGRHSKSVNTEKQACGSCRGRLELMDPVTKDGTPIKRRQPSQYNLFVKEHYASIKEKNPSFDMGRVLKEVNILYSAHKNTLKNNPVNQKTSTEKDACIVRSYLQWLEDSDYDTSCTLCKGSLKEGEVIRLQCYDLFHSHCLNKYGKSFPPNTAPPGFVCFTCQSSIFPPDNASSPVANELRKKLVEFEWARVGLGSYMASIQLNKPSTATGGAAPSSFSHVEDVNVPNGGGSLNNSIDNIPHQNPSSAPQGQSHHISPQGGGISTGSQLPSSTLMMGSTRKYVDAVMNESKKNRPHRTIAIRDMDEDKYRQKTPMINLFGRLFGVGPARPGGAVRINYPALCGLIVVCIFLIVVYVAYTRTPGGEISSSANGVFEGGSNDAAVKEIGLGLDN
eukprot:Nk52_evm6s162 gene=Nk52_evmTU6s162